MEPTLLMHLLLYQWWNGQHIQLPPQRLQELNGIEWQGAMFNDLHMTCCIFSWPGAKIHRFPEKVMGHAVTWSLYNLDQQFQWQVFRLNQWNCQWKISQPENWNHIIVLQPEKTCTSNVGEDIPNFNVADCRATSGKRKCRDPSHLFSGVFLVTKALDAFIKCLFFTCEL